jgi:hypothetical protein
LSLVGQAALPAFASAFARSLAHNLPKSIFFSRTKLMALSIPVDSSKNVDRHRI